MNQHDQSISNIWRPTQPFFEFFLGLQPDSRLTARSLRRWLVTATAQLFKQLSSLELRSESDEAELEILAETAVHLGIDAVVDLNRVIVVVGQNLSLATLGTPHYPPHHRAP